jgi:hypothetical protein
LVLSGSFDTPEDSQEDYATGYVLTDEHKIRVVIDPKDLIPERDTTNNEGTFTCSPDTHSCS